MGVYGKLIVELSDDDRYPKGATVPLYLSDAQTPEPTVPVEGALPAAPATGTEPSPTPPGDSGSDAPA